MTDDEFAKELEAVSLKDTEAWLQDLIDRKILIVDTEAPVNENGVPKFTVNPCFAVVEGGD